MNLKQQSEKARINALSIFHDIKNKIIGEDTKSIYIGITIIIGLLLIVPPNVTWAVDRLNYLDYANYSHITLGRYYESGFGTVFSNEPLFLLINIFLAFIFSPENILRIIIFSSTFLVLYSLGKKTNFSLWVLSFFVLIPQFNKNHIIHLRQGLALGVYLLSLNQKNNKISWVLKVVAVLIHTSIAFMILFELLDSVIEKLKIKHRYKMLIVAALFFVFVNSFSLISLFIADRRFEEYAFSVATGASGLGFILWLFVGIFFITLAKKTYTNRLCFYGIIFYLVSYYFVEFGARVFENIIPLIIVGMINEENKKIRLLYIAFLIFYGVVQYYTLGGFNFYKIN
ncbi:MAG: EpsG family protein [Carnobacterium sp.]|uniref:EpsG family protein n=1 Tax=Carnobacterium sp. TaxID=48221 RepID=UPI003C75EE5D